MHIIFLRFGSNRAQASEHAAAHLQWIQQGISSGVFLLAGSLDQAQGGVVLATGIDRAEIERVVAEDPFVAHGIVDAEIRSITPARMAEGMAALLRDVDESAAAG
ncbi:YciI family protein [Thermomonas sp. HDW16]|uniref:YciI family protein n=1 Tax=Thermomonas sp. HDW16 TaxID=2714945 RepID=UPI00140A078A|nr:YciI family protein [Thermomonas sp. HDW16]QIL19340.1 hypothetical protein G7079_00535 [Thermomonas sp. HDW16]